VVLSIAIGGATALVTPRHVVWARSAYSGESYLLMFAHEPSEDSILDALIVRDPLISEPARLKSDWRAARSNGTRVFIKLDDERSVAVEPYSPEWLPDVVFPDGRTIQGVWLTEPETRVHLGGWRLRAITFGSAFVATSICLLAVPGGWYFLLRRCSEVSRAVRGQ
jgi:hypothetical protein